jgi:TRAP-type uncharacterized transport system fused permease subunit
VDVPAVETAREIVDKVEAGRRRPGRAAGAAITLLCLAWSGYQLFIAYRPIDSHVARAFHLAFALLLAYLLYPSYDQDKPPFWIRWPKALFPFIGTRSNVRSIPWLDLLLGVAAAVAALFIWWDFDKLVWRQGIPSTIDIVLGTTLIVLLLEGARRALGPALAVLATFFSCFTR